MSTARLKQVNFDTHIKPKSISIPDTKTGDNGTAMLPKKVRISKIPAKRFLYRSLWAQIFEKTFQTFEKKLKKKFLGRSWAKIGLRKTQPNVISKRQYSESSPDIDPKNHDCTMKSERGALVRGSDPPSGQCSQSNRWYVAGAGQALDSNTFGRCCVENRRRNYSILLRWQK